MKKSLRRLTKIVTVLLVALFITSCGVEYNTVGITFGNFVNGGEVTFQGKYTFYIQDGDIYRTDDVKKEGEVILEGDFSSINVVQDKLYFYDNEISTICKSNMDGKKLERIAELYCDSFIVNRDNIYATVITGQGGDDIEDPDNHNVVRLKITDRKLTNQVPVVIVKKGKLIGCIGDNIYVEKKDKDEKLLYQFDLEGKAGKSLFALLPGDKVVGDSESLYVLGTKEAVYGIYRYELNGTFDKRLVAVGKKQDSSGNAINIDGEYIYCENYGAAANGAPEDKIVKLRIGKDEKTVIETFNYSTEFKVAIGSNGLLYRAKATGKVEEWPKWIGVE